MVLQYSYETRHVRIAHNLNHVTDNHAEKSKDARKTIAYRTVYSALDVADCNGDTASYLPCDELLDSSRMLTSETSSVMQPSLVHGHGAFADGLKDDDGKSLTEARSEVLALVELPSSRFSRCLRSSRNE